MLLQTAMNNVFDTASVSVFGEDVYANCRTAQFVYPLFILADLIPQTFPLISVSLWTTDSEIATVFVATINARSLRALFQRLPGNALAVKAVQPPADCIQITYVIQQVCPSFRIFCRSTLDDFCTSALCKTNCRSLFHPHRSRSSDIPPDQ